MSKTAVIVLCAAGVFFSGIYIGYENRPAFAKVTNVINKDPEVSPTDSADFEPFWKAWQLIDQKYPGSEKISSQDRVYGAIAGLMGSLKDPYSVFFDPEASKQFDEQISGQFSGIGIEIGQKDGALLVIAPLKDSPAYQAGLQSGDQILKIGKQSTANMTIDDAIKLIRGEAGTTVDLTVAREGLSEPKTYTVIRQAITIPTVDTEKREKEGVFIIHLYNFSAQSADLFNNAMQEFKNSGYTKLVIDLRNNPGGYLDAAVSMASWFLPQGNVVVKEIGKQPDDVTYHISKGPGEFSGKIKMVVLANQGSASASEILAGALQDHHAATLMGTKTFGKGSVQELIQLTKDTSLKITVAKWYTPNGVSISQQGLTPDVVVVQKPDDKTDVQLDAAVNYLTK